MSDSINDVTEKVKEYADVTKIIKITQEKLKILNKLQKKRNIIHLHSTAGHLCIFIISYLISYIIYFKRENRRRVGERESDSESEDSKVGLNYGSLPKLSSRSSRVINDPFQIARLYFCV